MELERRRRRGLRRAPQRGPGVVTPKLLCAFAPGRRRRRASTSSAPRRSARPTSPPSTPPRSASRGSSSVSMLTRQTRRSPGPSSARRSSRRCRAGSARVTLAARRCGFAQQDERVEERAGRAFRVEPAASTAPVTPADSWPPLQDARRAAEVHRALGDHRLRRVDADAERAVDELGDVAGVHRLRATGRRRVDRRRHRRVVLAQERQRHVALASASGWRSARRCRRSPASPRRRTSAVAAP